jgi:hypothetical protein
MQKPQICIYARCRRRFLITSCYDGVMSNVVRRVGNGRTTHRDMEARLWRGLFLAELCVCLAALTLFWYAYPDRYRTKLWQNGGDEGWNSDPKQRIYFYANYKTPPDIPLIWSQRYVSHQHRSSFHLSFR